MTEEDKSYLAGIVDGCGYVHIRKYTPKGDKPRAGIPTYALALVISNKDLKLIEWLVKTLGYGYVRKEEKFYRWISTGKRVGYLLQDIRAYLVIKKDQADIAIDYVADMTLLKGRTDLSEAQMLKRKRWHRDLIALHATA